jgi:hypothetical protein
MTVVSTRFRRRFGWLVTHAVVLSAGGAWAATPDDTKAEAEGRAIRKVQAGVLTMEAVTEDPLVAVRACQSLRALGPEGLSIFRDAHEQALARLVESGGCACTAGSAERRLADAVDRIAGQRDAAAANLFWYTDLPAARQAAEREGKPILSLHLMGKLTDELSCANSRFFRTTLYVDPEIGAVLRNNFILHWQSVRPVPKITIDFGDGRRLERTLTGNSIHYILDAHGRVVDALPGLYSPQAFRRMLVHTAQWARQLDQPEKATRDALATAFHRGEVQRLDHERKMMTSKLGMSAPGVFSQDLDIPFPKSSLETIAARAVTSASLPDISTRDGLRNFDREALDIETLTPPADHAELEIELSPAARRMIRSKLAGIPGEFVSRPREDIENAAISRLVRGIAFDTARSEYDFHRRIHEWLAKEPNVGVESLNERVYAELFLAPRSDPWMGLFDVRTFSAIDGAGIVIDE